MTCTPHIQPLQEDEDGTSTLQRSHHSLRRTDRQAGQVGGQGLVAGRVEWWPTGWQGQEVGWFGWLARLDGRQGRMAVRV